MPYPLKITDTLRNWNIAKSYLKNGPNIRNIINALKYILDGPSSKQTGSPPILPGFHLKGLLQGSMLELLLSKLGTISTNTVKSYSPLEETILKKYELFPKMFGKVFKDLKPQIVDGWYEFAIPKNMLLMELIYKNGGSL